MSNNENNDYPNNNNYSNNNGNNGPNYVPSRLGSTRSHYLMRSTMANQENQPLFALKNRSELRKRNQPLSRYPVHSHVLRKHIKKMRNLRPEELPRNTQTALNKAHQIFKSKTGREKLFENIRMGRASAASESGAQVFTTVFNKISSYLNDPLINSKEELSRKIRNALRSAERYVDPRTLAVAQFGETLRARQSIGEERTARMRETQEGKKSSRRHRGGGKKRITKKKTTKKKTTKKVTSKK